jgi:hypothetical protein
MMKADFDGFLNGSPCSFDVRARRIDTKIPEGICQGIILGVGGQELAKISQKVFSPSLKIHLEDRACLVEEALCGDRIFLG